jgi:hypothetical protein
VVAAGASAGGLATAEALRRLGFDLRTGVTVEGVLSRGGEVSGPWISAAVPGSAQEEAAGQA